MKVLLNKLHFPVTTLGFGRRVGIWFQGCSIRCPGCISHDTWEAGAEHEIPLEDVMAALAPWLAHADGVTISGGEPFDQPEALFELVGAIRRGFAGDVLAYSGHSFDRLEEEHSGILGRLDVLISEPYRLREAQTRWLRGSDNQRLHLLSALGRERYGDRADAQAWPRQRRLDLMEQNGELWLAGIPAPGMLGQLEGALAARGHRVAQTSQQAVLPVRA
ncbi:MAG: 4Fe-4S single cluster domain-containing protein [Verrucomicrobiota bacterium]